MLHRLSQLDQSFFLFLNGFHCPFMDEVMYWGTHSLTWLPLYALFLYLVIRKYRQQTFWIVIFAAFMILASDQLSNIFKELVARPRPTHDPGLTGIHTVNGYVGGQFGFYSAHASTNLAIAIYLVILLGNPFRFFSVLVLGWAFFMSYSRIYLGVHYPADILAGWVAGGLIGWACGRLCAWYLRKPLRIN